MSIHQKVIWQQWMWLHVKLVWMKCVECREERQDGAQEETEGLCFMPLQDKVRFCVMTYRQMIDRQTDRARLRRTVIITVRAVWMGGEGQTVPDKVWYEGRWFVEVYILKSLVIRCRSGPESNWRRLAVGVFDKVEVKVLESKRERRLEWPPLRNVSWTSNALSTASGAETEFLHNTVIVHRTRHLQQWRNYFALTNNLLQPVWYWWLHWQK